MKSYDQFKDDLGKRESSNNYQCVNDYGFLGRYQFGMPRLCDLGVCRKGDGDQLVWNQGLTKDLFLNSPDLQDAVFDLHVGLYRVYLLSRYQRYLNKDNSGVPTTLSGCVAGVHLKGPGGLYKFLVKKIDSADALGTNVSDYVLRFSGYEIPSNLPQNQMKVREIATKVVS